MEPSHPTSPPGKTPLLRSRRDLVLVTSLLVAAALWFGNAPVHPQKLAEVTPPTRDGGAVTLLGTYGDRIYLFRRDEGAVLAVPRKGGQPELVGSKRPELLTANSVGILGSDLLFQDDGLSANMVPPGSPERNRKLQLGAVYRMPLAGGDLVPVPFPQLQGHSALVVGNACFAVEARPLPVQGPSQSRIGVPLPAPRPIRIWCFDTEHPTARLAGIAPPLDLLLETVVGRGGFYARTPQRDRLVHVRQDGPAEITAVSPTARLLAEAGNDLAWSEIEPGNGTDPAITSVYLTRPDGSERRPLFRVTAPAGRQRSLLSLAMRNGKWFGIIHEVNPAGGAPPQQLVARFLPGRKQAVQVLAALPKTRPVDRWEEADLDFLAVEEKERWWDWSAAGLIAQRTTNLYRFPLPVR